MFSHRAYRSSDIDAMYALDVVCFDRRFRFSRRAMRRFAEDPNARVVIAEENDAIVGFLILQVERTEAGPVGYIVTLDVATAQRRRGVARSLLQAVERQAVAESCIALALHVFVENAAALRFYQNLGFVQGRQVRGFYGSSLDAWIYSKSLPVRQT